MIELKRRTDKGQPGHPYVVSAGELDMEAGRVVFRGVEPRLAELLVNINVVVPFHPCQHVTVEDGEAWLKALPANLRGLLPWHPVAR